MTFTVHTYIHVDSELTCSRHLLSVRSHVVVCVASRHLCGILPCSTPFCDWVILHCQDGLRVIHLSLSGFLGGSAWGDWKWYCWLWLYFSELPWICIDFMFCCLEEPFLVWFVFALFLKIVFITFMYVYMCVSVCVCRCQKKELDDWDRS